MRASMPRRSVLTAVVVAMPLLLPLAGCHFADRGSHELAATVYNAVSKEPFEGAMVVAIYKQCGSSFAATACWCVRTAAVRTGKDGVFKFPVTATEGLPELAIFAPGHYLKDFQLPTPEAYKKRDKSYYTSWDLWLAPQDPENPAFRYESARELPCQRAVSEEDARAGEEFEAATNAERARLLHVVVDRARQNAERKPEKNGAIASMERTIDVLQPGEARAEAKAQKSK